MTLAVAKALLSCGADYSDLPDQAIACMQELGRRWHRYLKRLCIDVMTPSHNHTLDEIRPAYHFDVTCQGSVPQAIEAFL